MTFAKQHGYVPEDLTAPQMRVLLKLYHETVYVRGPEVRVAGALERMGLARLTDYGSSPIDGSHNGDGQRWQAPLTNDGEALAQRELDRREDAAEDRRQDVRHDTVGR